MVARRRNGYWKQLKFPGKSPPTGAVALANIYTPWPRRKDKGINTDLIPLFQFPDGEPSFYRGLAPKTSKIKWQANLERQIETLQRKQAMNFYSLHCNPYC
jgi:hypothetical protein